MVISKKLFVQEALWLSLRDARSEEYRWLEWQCQRWRTPSQILRIASALGFKTLVCIFSFLSWFGMEPGPPFPFQWQFLGPGTLAGTIPNFLPMSKLRGPTSVSSLDLWITWFHDGGNVTTLSLMMFKSSDYTRHKLRNGTNSEFFNPITTS
jgi:hypothetical protein